MYRKVGGGGGVLHAGLTSKKFCPITLRFSALLLEKGKVLGKCA